MHLEVATTTPVGTEDAKVGDVRHAVAQHIHALATMSKKRRNAIMALTKIDN